VSQQNDELVSKNARAKALALEINSCQEVIEAFNDKSHPCHEVVKWQADQWKQPILQIENSKMHRPEAWTGDIVNAPILFLSSNPSFNAEENYPNWQLNKDEWLIDKVADFSINRFTSNIKRAYGASDGLSVDQIDRTIGKNGELLKKVTYWSWARNIVSFIHGKDISEVSAHSDYAMTEIVHCKSKAENGVEKARMKCKDKYLERILELSNAQLIFISGQHACADIKAIYPKEFPSDWGLWNADGSSSDGFWPRKVSRFPSEIEAGKWSLDAQLKHSVSFDVAGRMRTFQYWAKSGGGAGLTAPKKYPELVHPEVLKNWRKLIDHE
jgi:hypothetical protein